MGTARGKSDGDSVTMFPAKTLMFMEKMSKFGLDDVAGLISS